MTKNEAVKLLKTLPCRYAEVVTDVWATNGGIIYPKETIIVSVLETQNPYDEKFFGKVYTTCESIRDFRENCVFGEDEARKHYCNYYFGNIYSVTPIY